LLLGGEIYLEVPIRFHTLTGHVSGKKYYPPCLLRNLSYGFTSSDHQTN